MATVTETKRLNKWPNLTLKIPSQIPTELICFICKNVVTDAVIAKCGHCMCQTCFSFERMIGKCKCGEKIGDIGVAGEIVRTTNDQLTCPDCDKIIPKERWTNHVNTCSENVVKCVNHHKGCNVSGTFDEIFAEHVNVCPFSDTKCQFCGITLLIKELKEHHESFKCEGVKRSCRYRCGIVDRKKSEIDQHELECSERPDKCTFLQCHFKCTYEGVKQHEKEATSDHLKLASTKIFQLEIDNKTIRENQQKMMLMMKELMKRGESRVNDAVSALIHTWCIPMFWKKMTQMEPGQCIKGHSFLYKRKEAKYPYTLRLLLYPCGKLDDPGNVYVYLKDEGTPKDYILQWPILHKFLIRFSDGKLIDIGSVYERRDTVTGGILGTKDEVA